MEDIKPVVENIYESSFFQAFIVLVIGFILLAVAVHILKKILRKSRIDPALYKFFENIARVAGIVIIIVGCLDKLNVNTTSFIAVLGAAGAAIALALKDSLSNVAGGILILVNKPFGQGDLVEMGGTIGNVEEIGILTTSLKTADNQLVIVPNGIISNSVITNYHKTEDRRVVCNVCVSYDTDIEKMKKVISEVVNKNAFAKRNHACKIGISENGADGMIVDILTWCDPGNYQDAKYYMEENIKLAFDKAQISMPYQIREVIIRK